MTDATSSSRPKLYRPTLAESVAALERLNDSLAEEVSLLQSDDRADRMEKQRNAALDSEHALSDRYVRLRTKLGALDVPKDWSDKAPSLAHFTYTEQKLDELIAERDRLQGILNGNQSVEGALQAQRDDAQRKLESVNRARGSELAHIDQQAIQIKRLIQERDDWKRQHDENLAHTATMEPRIVSGVSQNALDQATEADRTARELFALRVEHGRLQRRFEAQREHYHEALEENQQLRKDAATQAELRSMAGELLKPPARDS